MSQPMRARLVAKGWERDLVVEPFPDALAAPAGQELVVEVEACGVCYRDCIDRAGRFAFIRVPITPGHEAVGRVVAVGPDVRDFAVGDRVASMHRDFCGACPACTRGDTSLCASAAAVLGLIVDGGYATHVRAPQRCWFAVPDGVPATTAAIMHCTFGTAYRGLRSSGGLDSGQHALVTGANGGVGCAAVQVATRLGAKVTAVVRDAQYTDWLTELGADRVIVDRDGEFHKQLGGDRADVVLDCVGQPTFNASLRSLRIGGRLIAVGNIVPERASLNLGYIITSALRIIGSSGATRDEMAALWALHAERPFVATVHETVPLSRADAAQRMVTAGGLRGRIVLVPEE